ncbi:MULTISPECIES: aldehyde dehydrogenase family protein [unclassified Microbacterium]|uniref:aldehyde dehydrogenase family protein n=1 Tax=unclassified Microbacterium TaxID=2609290 RepID=UPI003017E9A7
MSERGIWIDNAERLGSGATLVVRSPYDDHVVARIASASPADVEAAIRSAARAHGEVLRHLPAHERSAALRRIADGIRARHDELVDTVVEEGGKPVRDARREIGRAAQLFSMAADLVATMPIGAVLPMDSVPGGEGRFGYTMRVPVGVIAAIVPSNSPINLAANKVAPALAMGNAVVMKPADQTPVSALMLAEIVRDAGLPAGALNVVIGSVDDAARPLVTDDRVRMVTVTGGVATGRAIAATAGLKKLTLELGSSAANVVCADADPVATARTLATSAFLSSGQACISAQRLIVHSSIIEEFSAELVRAAQAMVIGDPRDPETEIGPLASASHLEQLLEWIDQAKSLGATVLTGGECHERTIRPTVLRDVPAEAALSCEEAFGPIATLAAFDTIEEAFALVNDSRFGLQAGLFTNDLQTAFRAASEIDVGALWINDSSRYRQDNYPFGGRKLSGIGREGVEYAMEEMSELRFVGIRLASTGGLLG